MQCIPKTYRIFIMDENILADLVNVPILTELSPQELNIIAPYWHYVFLQPSDILFSEGDPADGLYYVLEGEFIIYKNNDGAIPLELTHVKQHQFFGEQAVLENSYRSGTLQASEASRILMISNDGFYEILEKYPHIGVILLKGIARYLSLQLRKTTGQYVAIFER